MSRIFIKSLLFLLAVNNICCDDDFPDDSTCSATQKCKQPNTACRDGVCGCKEFYVQDSNGKCVKAPAVGEKCLLADGSILDCKGAGVDASCPVENVCKCLPGYEKVGKVCKFKDKKLNDACESDIDCGIAFAGCSNGKCVCSNGFKVQNGLCTSDKKCPGDATAIKGSDGKPKSCEVKRRESSDKQATEEEQACGANGFCFYHPLVRSKPGLYTGHCCPIPKTQAPKLTPACPVGDPIPVDSCASDSDDSDNANPDGPASSGKIQSGSSSGCPSLTHTCIYAANSTFCCPVPCPGSFSFFAQNGKCIEILSLGQPCSSTAQCGPRAICPEDNSAKVCSCKPEYNLVDGDCELKGSK